MMIERDLPRGFLLARFPRCRAQATKWPRREFARRATVRRAGAKENAPTGAVRAAARESRRSAPSITFVTARQLSLRASSIPFASSDGAVCSARSYIMPTYRFFDTSSEGLYTFSSFSPIGARPFKSRPMELTISEPTVKASLTERPGSSTKTESVSP